MEKEFQMPSNIPVIDKPEDFKNLPGVHFTENVEPSEKPTEKPGIITVEKQPIQQPNPPSVQHPLPGIRTGERTYEGFVIPDNIPVFEKPEDVYEIPKNIPVKENTITEELPKEVLSEEEKNIWDDVLKELSNKSSEFVKFDGQSNKIDESKLIEWLKEKLSGISFCQVYLTDKLDGENGIVKENSSLILETDNGSKMYLDKGGRYHRLDGPAIEWHYGATEWFKNGIRHRIGGPAYESKDEKQYWFEGKQYTETEYWLVAQEITYLK